MSPALTFRDSDLVFALTCRQTNFWHSYDFAKIREGPPYSTEPRPSSATRTTMERTSGTAEQVEKCCPLSIWTFWKRALYGGIGTYTLHFPFDTLHSAVSLVFVADRNIHSTQEPFQTPLFSVFSGYHIPSLSTKGTRLSFSPAFFHLDQSGYTRGKLI